MQPISLSSECPALGSPLWRPLSKPAKWMQMLISGTFEILFGFWNQLQKPSSTQSDLSWNSPQAASVSRNLDFLVWKSWVKAFMKMILVWAQRILMKPLKPFSKSSLCISLFQSSSGWQKWLALALSGLIKRGTFDNLMKNLSVWKL